MSAVVTCFWCQEKADLSGLVGEGANQCPSCVNPTLPMQFGDLSTECSFLCNLGGRWKKRSPSKAVCVESDSAFCVGQIAGFFPDEDVFPCEVRP